MNPYQGTYYEDQIIINICIWSQVLSKYYYTYCTENIYPVIFPQDILPKQNSK